MVFPMFDDAARDNLLSYIGTGPRQLVQGEPLASGDEFVRPTVDVWASLWLVAAAHDVELRRAGVLDDDGFVAIARSLLAARQSNAADLASARDLVNELDQRIEAQTPASVSGAATLGLAREEWLATAARLVWRNVALNLMECAVQASDSALVLAETHLVTIMPAFLSGRPVQPTTFAHYLGAAIGPLQTGRARLIEAYGRLNRSPLGAGMMAGDVLAADRDDLARRLGFDGQVPNTLDALSSVEDLVGVLDALAAVVNPIGRFVAEMRNWIRTDPMSFVLDEGWTSIPEPGHPALVLADKLDLLHGRLAEYGDAFDALRKQVRRLDYGPLGIAHDAIVAAAATIDVQGSQALSTATELFSTGLIVNRAYLGNRAGRGFTTASDVATFLMTEEQIAPTAARRIAVLVLAQLKESGLEVSGITPDMIDSAALITIGREIKVEMETLGRYLAPRRYIERRQVAGSPAPETTRAWLAEERNRLTGDRQWLDSAGSAVTAAVSALTTTIEDTANESSEG